MKISLLKTVDCHQSPGSLKPQRPKQSMSVHAGNNPEHGPVCRTSLTNMFFMPCILVSAPVYIRQRPDRREAAARALNNEHS